MKELELPSWTSFKETCITRKNLNCQFSESLDRYELYGPDGYGFIWHTTILKVNPRENDQADFEENYKSAFNWAISNRQYWAATPDAQLSAKGYVLFFDKSPDGSPKTTSRHIRWDLDAYLNGGEWWTVGAIDGDIMDVTFVDKDNLLQIPGFDSDNPTALVAPNYFDTWNILAKDRERIEFRTPYAARPPVGMYLQIKMTTKAMVADPVIYIGLFRHKPL